MNKQPEEQTPTPGQTKYKGVRLRKWGKWVAEIRLPNSRERIWLGSYDSQEKAARAFDAALFCLRGPHAKFNFPDQPLPDILDAHSLTPHDIQQLAAEFANNQQHSTRADQNDVVVVVVDPPLPMAQYSNDSFSSSTSVKDEHNMDWSFLDSLDPIDKGGASSSNLFPLYSDEFDNILANDFYEFTEHPLCPMIDDHGPYDGVSSDAVSFSNQSFLWNFDNH